MKTIPIAVGCILCLSLWNTTHVAAQQLQGRVSDQNSDAIEGAQVWMMTEYENLFVGISEQYLTTRTDEKGEFSFPIPKAWDNGEPGEAVGNVWCLADQTLSTATIYSRHVNGEAMLEIESHKETGNAEWQILTPEGNPIPKVRVRPVSVYEGRRVVKLPKPLSKNLERTTDGKGLVKVPIDTFLLTRFVEVDSDDYGTQRIGIRNYQGSMKSPLTMRAVGSVVGKVSHPDGSPADSVGIRLMTDTSPTSNMGIAIATTDKNGEFEVNAIAVGDMFIQPVLGSDNQFMLKGESGRVVEGGKTRLNLVRDASLVKVVGKVTNRDTSRPVAGVIFNFRGDSIWRQATSDENGMFTVRLAPGKNFVTVTPVKDLVHIPSGEYGFDIPKQETDFDFPIQLYPVVKVKGILVNNDGQRIPRSSVHGKHQDHNYGFALTDENGEFEIELPKGIKFTEFKVMEGGTNGVKCFIKQANPLILRIEPLW